MFPRENLINDDNNFGDTSLSKTSLLKVINVTYFANSYQPKAV